MWAPAPIKEEKMIVRYKGYKAKVPVPLPIGVKSRMAVRETRWADPFVTLDEADALKLVKLDPHNFEIASDQDFKPTVGQEIKVVVTGPTPVKRGRGRPKANATAA